MSKKKYTKEEALAKCFEMINPKDLEFDEYNKLRQYKVRHSKGTLGEGAIKTLFERFGVSENCYYTFGS